MKMQKITNNECVYNKFIDPSRLPVVCMLCETGELGPVGHIIPKFAMRWLKNVSKRQSFFLNNNPMDRPSDTMAVYFLCEECEGKFSNHEKYFTDNYFKPYYRQGRSPFPTMAMYYFSISVAWRVLVATCLMRSTANVDTSIGELKYVLWRWLNGNVNRLDIDVHVLDVRDLIESTLISSFQTELLKYSILQGVYIADFKFQLGDILFSATVKPIAVVYFKLGGYFFIVTPAQYFEALRTPKIDFKKSDLNMHMLMPSKDLIDFIQEITKGDFLGCDDAALKEDFQLIAKVRR